MTLFNEFVTGFVAADILLIIGIVLWLAWSKYGKRMKR